MTRRIWDEHRHDAARGIFVRRRSGPDDAPHLVWLHGLGESGLCFESIALLPPLDRFTHWILDLPGYGRAPWPAMPPGIDDTTARVIDWLGELGRPAVLLGHSLGGVIALRVAQGAPERVAALIDVEGNKSIGDCTFSGQAVDVELDEFVGVRFEAMLAHIYRASTDEAALRGYYASLRLCDRRTFHRQANELVALSRGESLAAELAALPMPATYIAGNPGGACPRSRALLAATTARVIEIAPAGHWPFIDQPRAFAGAAWEAAQRED